MLEQSGLRSIRLLSGFSQLIWLSLRVNHIEDVTPRRSLTNLEHLLIDSNEISELPLDFLTELKTLSLYDNDILDLSGLSALSQLGILTAFDNLASLLLFNNQIADL